MAKGFYTKGKGASRKVVPITPRQPKSKYIHYTFSKDNVAQAKIDAERTASMYYGKNIPIRQKLSYKRALVSAANQAKASGHPEVAAIYEAAYKQMAVQQQKGLGTYYIQWTNEFGEKKATPIEAKTEKEARANAKLLPNFRRINEIEEIPMSRQMNANHGNDYKVFSDSLGHKYILKDGKKIFVNAKGKPFTGANGMKIMEVQLMRAEGPSKECGKTMSFPSIAAADAQLTKNADTAPSGGAYDRHYFKIFFANGQTYEGRYDLHKGETGDIGLHVDNSAMYMLKVKETDAKRFKDADLKFANKVRKAIVDSKRSPAELEQRRKIERLREKRWVKTDDLSKRQINGAKGTLAGLSEQLHKKGYHYVSSDGGYNMNTGVTTPKTYLIFKNETTGKTVIMRKIKSGSKSQSFPQPEGATSWIAHIGGGPDTYKLEET